MVNIKKKKIAVLCDTKEKIIEFYSIAGSKLDNGAFNCDYPNNLYIGYDLEGDLCWDSCGYYLNNGYKLITFEEYTSDDMTVEYLHEILSKMMSANLGDFVIKTDEYNFKEDDLYINHIAKSVRLNSPTKYINRVIELHDKIKLEIDKYNRGE